MSIDPPVTAGWRRYYGAVLKPDQWRYLDALCAEELSRKLGRAGG
jgi:hypothetical protein